MNQDLLRQLYQRYQREIYLYLYSLCHNREIAEDLRQETFLKAIFSLSDTHENMRAWLYMVARNLYFNYIKREKMKMTMEEAGEGAEQNSLPLLEKIIQNEQKQILYKALQHLPVARREILTLHYFGGMSQKEIAAILHQSPENVRVQAYRGKKQLKAYMEVHGYDIS